MTQLLDALAILEMHPDGLPLRQLADELGESPESLREAFLAYYRADVVDIANFRLPVIEFIGADSEADDPATAEVIRVNQPDPERELGVAYLSAEQLGALYAAGADLLALEPDNLLLSGALAAFRDGLLAPPSPDATVPGADYAQSLNAAAHQRHKVRIVYSRAWLPGTSERILEPYRVIRTRRGWELDSGPPDESGRIRTFLVSGIRDLQLLDEGFERPQDADALIRANRQPVEVELVVPQSGRWAVDRFAETVRVLQDDEDSVKLLASFLPPVEQRVGLILISCGPDAFAMSPPVFQDAGTDLARRLLEHHRR
jgi:predicted DNA-binding transcriptional regulator YafY